MNIILRKVSRFIRPLAYLIGLLMPINDKKIVVSNFSGKGYGDNPKYIVNELLKINANLEIIWLLQNEEDKSSLPKEVNYCLEKSFMSTYHLRTAKIWIDNCRKSFRYKRSEQFHLQTWHGFALKRIEQDVQENLSKGYVKGAIRDSKHIDLIVSCSKFMTELYRNSFWYDGKVLELGAPRNDVFVQKSDEIKRKVFKYFGIGNEKAVALYAPTFRADKSLHAYSIDYEILKKACKNKFGKEFVILVRLHPSISDKNLDINFDGEQLINANLYQDLQELLFVADVVVSDYSSLIFDFALSRKPCFLFATDIDSYRNDRNFYLDLFKLPFSVAETNEALQKNILDFNDEIYKKSLEEFFDAVGMVMPGQASKKCAQLIWEIIKNKN